MANRKPDDYEAVRSRLKGQGLEVLGDSNYKGFFVRRDKGPAKWLPMRQARARTGETAHEKTFGNVAALEHDVMRAEFGPKRASLGGGRKVRLD